jgi:hypothetical protein
MEMNRLICADRTPGKGNEEPVGLEDGRVQVLGR